MKRRIPISIRALIASAFLATTLSIGAITTSAQPLLWNPPCGNVTIINCSPCLVHLNLATNPPGVVPQVAVSPFSTLMGVPTGPPPLFINGINTQGGAFVPMIQPPGGVTPPQGCGILPLIGPVNGVVRGVEWGPPGAPSGCCVDVYFNTSLDPSIPCTILIFPGTPPCTP